MECTIPGCQHVGKPSKPPSILSESYWDVNVCRKQRAGPINDDTMDMVLALPSPTPYPLPISQVRSSRWQIVFGGFTVEPLSRVSPLNASAQSIPLEQRSIEFLVSEPDSIVHRYSLALLCFRHCFTYLGEYPSK